MSDPTTRLLRVANAHASIECPIYCILLSRKYIIVAAESGFLYWVSLEDFEIAYAKDTETKGIFTATFAPDYLSFVSADLSSTLMHGTFAGDIAVLTEETRQNDKWVKLTPILQRPLAVNLFSHEPVAYGLDSFVSSNRVVSFGLDGSLMVWDYGTNELVGLHYFQAAVTAVACNPDDTLIGVGFESGAVGIVDATAPSQLRLIFLERMHEKPVKFVKFSSNGQMLVTVGEDSRVFFIRVRDLSAVGYRQVPFDVCAFNVFPCAGMDRVFVSSMHGQLQTMQLPPLGTTAPTGYMLDDDLIKPHISDIQIAATALHQDLGNDKWFIVLGMDKKLRRIEFSGTKAQLDIKSVYEGHAKVASVITVSPDGRFLATGGCDGAIIIRRTDNMFNQVKISPHSFASRGGVIGLQFTNDSRFLISSGADGAIFCWNLQQIVRRDSSKRDALKPIIQPQVLVEVPSVEEFEERADAQTGEGDIVLPPLFLDKMREEQARVLSNESQEKRNAFRTELQVLSDRFQQALQRNQMLPEIEKLEREAFIIDEAEVARVNAEVCGRVIVTFTFHLFQCFSSPIFYREKKLPTMCTTKFVLTISAKSWSPNEFAPRRGTKLLSTVAR
jgi:WD40 repeat protein